MCKAHDHTIHGAHHHLGWDRSIPPVLTVAPGTTIEFECLDASGGQLTRDSTLADVSKLDFGKVNPVTGPVFLEGAEPGDAVKVTLHEFKPSGFGWTANIPGFGLLDCRSQIGNEIERTVTWSDETNLASMAGKPIRLRFVMRDADVFAFQFRE